MRLRVPGVIAPALGIVSMVAVLAKAAEVYKEGILSLPPLPPPAIIVIDPVELGGWGMAIGTWKYH